MLRFLRRYRNAIDSSAGSHRTAFVGASEDEKTTTNYARRRASIDFVGLGGQVPDASTKQDKDRPSRAVFCFIMHNVHNLYR